MKKRIYSNEHNRFSPFDLGIECEKSADSLKSTIDDLNNYTEYNVLTHKEFEVLQEAYLILLDAYKYLVYNEPDLERYK